MKYVTLPAEHPRELPFYLAMEEYLARTCREELFFMWQVEPTVIFGRNQLIEREVNLDYCRQHGISVYRRKSGGGCVYADMSNIMMSYITSSDDVCTTFGDYTGKVAAMLRSLGLPAEATGRNDVTIGGRKVSGNAFYHIPGRSIVHGTMLYDTDAANMARAISPSPEKLSSKGVESVRSHITTISDHSDITLEEFKSYARNYLSDGEIRLTSHDVERISEIARPYFTHEWIYGHNPLSTRVICRRIDGVGEFQTELSVKAGKITDVNFRGDFFVTGDVDAVTSMLKGVAYDPESVATAVKAIDTSLIIRGLTQAHLIGLLFADHDM